MADLSVAEIKLKIAELEVAYEKLVLGQSVVMFIDQNGEQVRFAQANRTDLYNYILRWKMKLPIGDCSHPNIRGPLTFTFP